MPEHLTDAHFLFTSVFKQALSVGYRVNSHRGVQFRQWATQVLKENMIKGFVLNDDLLKNAGQGNYFEELLTRIRDIRSSNRA